MFGQAREPPARGYPGRLTLIGGRHAAVADLALRDVQLGAGLDVVLLGGDPASHGAGRHRAKRELRCNESSRIHALSSLAAIRQYSIVDQSGLGGWSVLAGRNRPTRLHAAP